MTATGLWSADVLATQLAEQRVLPVLRSASPRALHEDVSRLVSAGFTIIEITTSTPDWPTALERLQCETSWAHITFGVGTVISSGDAERALRAGARFLVSPLPAPAVRAAAGTTPFIEGGFTPGEISAAVRHGIAKLFPARTAGIGHLRSILEVLPGARIVPTGGLTLDHVEDWLAAGALAVGLGGGLLGRPVEELRAAFDHLRQIPSPPSPRPVRA